MSFEQKKSLFSFKTETNEYSEYKKMELKELKNDYETNHINIQEPKKESKNLDITESTNKINANLKNVENLTSIQSHFFAIHKNNMFKQLDIQVEEYYQVKVLEENAKNNYSRNLSKTEFIKVTMDYNKTEKDHREPPCYSMVDLYLVYVHTFLFLVNYFGLAQSSGDYSKALNLDPSTSGVLQAATPAASLFFGFFINHITRKKYKGPYIMCLSMLFTGNFLYFLAKSVGDINQTAGLVLLIAGRMIFGSGGSRLMTRKFLAIMVPEHHQSKYSTVLVAFSSMGDTFGPGFASALEYIPNTSFLINNFTVTIANYNIFSLAFFFIWLILFFIFLFTFKGYDQNLEKKLEDVKKNENFLKQKTNDLTTFHTTQNDQNLSKNLNIIDKNQENFMKSGFMLESSQTPNGNSIAISQKPTPIFRVYYPHEQTIFMLWCFLVMKVVQEAYFTEQPQMFDEFYGYGSQTVGWFMFGFTLVGLPTALLTGMATKKFEDRKILVISFVIYICSSIAKINYEFDIPQPFAQYAIASGFHFMATLMSEAAIIAILAKVISPNLKRGFFNAGMLSGTADTIGRALGNSSMTLFSSIRFVVFFFLI